MRPLASSLMLALLMLPPGDAGARELDGEAHEVTQGDPQEWWLLTNGAAFWSMEAARTASAHGTAAWSRS